MASFSLMLLSVFLFVLTLTSVLHIWYDRKQEARIPQHGRHLNGSLSYVIEL